MVLGKEDMELNHTELRYLFKAEGAQVSLSVETTTNGLQPKIINNDDNLHFLRYQVNHLAFHL